jgi:phage gp46-like protein
MTGDVAILFDPTYQAFDWSQNPTGDIADTNFAGTSGLESALVISLYTDRTMPPDWVFPQKGILNNPGGWWGDAFNPAPIGSHLWLLRFQSGAPNLLQIARNYCLDALQWLIDNGIAATIDVTPTWIFPNSQRAIGLAIVITEPVTNVTSRFQYSYAWQQV